MDDISVKEFLAEMMTDLVTINNIVRQACTTLLEIPEALTETERDTIIQLRKDSAKHVADIEWNAAYLAGDI